MSVRPVICYMFIGYNRTGKSSVMKDYATKWRISNPTNIIAGYDPQQRFTHLMDQRYRLSLGEKGWWMGNETRRKNGRLPLTNLRNALVILDDMRGLNPSYNTSEDLSRLMEFRAEYSIDIMMVIHSPGLLLEGISMFISAWFIFYTKGRKAKFEDKIEDYEECTAAANIMKKYVKDYPSITKRPDQFYDPVNGNRFPHIIVDTSDGVLIPQNINKEWLEKNMHEAQIPENPKTIQKSDSSTSNP